MGNLLSFVSLAQVKEWVVRSAYPQQRVRQIHGTPPAHHTHHHRYGNHGTPGCMRLKNVQFQRQPIVKFRLLSTHARRTKHQWNTSLPRLRALRRITNRVRLFTFVRAYKWLTVTEQSSAMGISKESVLSNRLFKMIQWCFYLIAFLSFINKDPIVFFVIQVIKQSHLNRYNNNVNVAYI